jgi:glycosyltransferase involved in cell wall biosynthesis
MRPQDKLAVSPGGVVVCVVHDRRAPTATAEALAVHEEHTAANVPVLVLGLSGQREPVWPTAMSERVRALVPSPFGGVADLLAQAVIAAEPADVVVMSSACRVPPGWLTRLQSAALSGDTVATATPLSGRWCDAAVVDAATGDPDQVVATAATRSYPRLQIGGPECLYIRRRALELIRGLPREPDTLGRLIESLCEAVIAAGLVNVLADDLYVAGDSREAVGTPSEQLSKQGELDRLDERSPLARAVSLSRAALGGLTVTVDGRSLGQGVGGTQRYTLDLAVSLARFTDAAVRVVVPPDLAPDAAGVLAETPAVEVITYEQAAAGVNPTDVVHRPQQIFSSADLRLLRVLGRRLVVTHQDLIGYHNPTYHETAAVWEQYRRVTRLALAAADRVVFFSGHSRRDAEAEDLVTADRCDVVGIALAPQPPVEPVAPARVPRGQEFILCLGADYRHKNRRFAILLARALRSQHEWRGQLVLAGSHVAHGSSAGEERELLTDDPKLRAAVLDLGGVDASQRAWLFAHARAIVVPSVVEGFGLVPLEAAAAGLPCLFADQSSLGEVVSGSLASLVPWNPSESAARVMPLLTDAVARREHVEQLRRDADRWRWERLAGELIATYEQSLRMPYRAAAVRAWQELEREQYLVEINHALLHVQEMHQDLLGHLGDRLALARDDGFLTAHEQRGLMRVGSRPAVARAVLWPFALLGAARSRRSGTGRAA